MSIVMRLDDATAEEYIRFLEVQLADLRRDNDRWITRVKTLEARLDMIQEIVQGRTPSGQGRG